MSGESPITQRMNETTNSECESLFGCGGSWWEIIGPVIAFVFVFIILITCCKCVFEFCKKHYFSNGNTGNSRSSNRNRVRQGSTNASYVRDDLPPSYSSARLGRENIEIFSVVTDEDYIGTSANVEEKLPSYLEIMEEKRKKNKTSPQRSAPDEMTVETESPHSVSDDVTEADQNDGDAVSLSESITAPPPYSATTPL